MKSSIKVRTAAMVASVATTFVMFHVLALNAYPAAAPAAAAAQIAKAEGRGEPS